MELYRIWALIIRNFIVNFRDFGRIIDFCYWPLLDIIVWGFTSTWIEQSNNNVSQVNLILLSGIVLWHVTFRANFEVSFNLLEELWSRNIINLFSTPLKISEWITAVIMLGVTNGLLANIFGALMVWLLYKISIFSVGLILVPCILSLLFSGLAIGFFTASLLIYWGQKVQKLVWALGWFFAPFSAVFYPLEILPKWICVFARLLPMTYTFEGIRSYVTTGVIPFSYIITSILLSSLYLTFAILFFNYMLNQSKIKGLARLESD